MKKIFVFMVLLAVCYCLPAFSQSLASRQIVVITGTQLLVPFRITVNHQESVEMKGNRYHSFNVSATSAFIYSQLTHEGLKYDAIAMYLDLSKFHEDPAYIWTGSEGFPATFKIKELGKDEAQKLISKYSQVP